MMDFLDFFLHLDKYLEQFFIDYQTLSYFIICLILFCETGLVVTPFLPGDSLLFAVGATIAKIGVLNVWVAIPLMLFSVILGDNVNYFLGNKLGKRLFETQHPLLKRLLKKEYLTRTEAFYAKHGGKTVVMARFVPIVRTFAPFVAGLGAMNYQKYIGYCLGGGTLWVVSLTLLGYFFGKTEFVSKHFEAVILGVIVISLLPPLVQVLVERVRTTKTSS
ncbi:MAG: cytochrome O ubiquinol oxidase [Saprospiraceae bacterium]|nr:cytochrome O ubiquinol oxidase [Saprospiraceae bacterium]